MIKKLGAFLTVGLLLGGLVVATQPASSVYAAECKNEPSLLPGAKPWYSGLCKPGSDADHPTNEIQLTTPAESAGKIGLNILNIILVLAGYVSVAYVMWGGFKYMSANGDSGSIASAKKIITNALIGLLISLSAVAIIYFIGGVYGIS